MVDSNIRLQPDSTGKKVQTFENVIGVDTVHAEAMVPVTSAGVEIAPATEATLGTVHGHVDSIDGKITACNTGAVVLAAGTASIGSISFKDSTSSQAINAADQYAEISCTGLASAGIQITDNPAAWVGTFEFRGTIDNATWQQVRAVQFGGTLVGGTTVNGLFFCQIGGLLKLRVYATAWTSGSAAVWVEGTAAANAVTLANALPTGTNNIGDVDVATLPAVTGTLTQSTKHDAATYKTAIFNAAADGDIVAAVANKKIKVHYLDVQAQGTVTVTIRNDDVAGTVLDVWKLQDREGAVKPFLPYPASHYVTNQVAGDALYCDVSAAVTVKICVVYTDADAA